MSYSVCLESNPLSQNNQTTIRSQLIVAATGLGKTVMMAGVAARWPRGRVMLVSHRFELNQQAIATFSKILREDVDLEQAGFEADQRTDKTRVVVASVQTLVSKRKGVYRMEKFDPLDFGLLLIDEAHHATAATYRRVINHFKQNPDLCVVGVTATPDRTDKVGLKAVFDHVTCRYDFAWGIENGWLCAPKSKIVYIHGLDLSSVRTVKGDLDNVARAKLMEDEARIIEVAQPIVDVCGDSRKAIVFASSVKHAEQLRDKINGLCYERFGKGDLAVSIDGSTPPLDPVRKQILKDFRDGTVTYLCNYGVATEGFDVPDVGVVAVARPTKSRSLYQQMVGRGGRTLPGTVDGIASASARKDAIARSRKPNFTVLDFVGQSGRHKLCCPLDILGGKEPPELIDEARAILRSAPADGMTVEEAIEKAAEARAEREAKARKKAILLADVQYELLDGADPYDLSIVPENKNMPWWTRQHKPSEKQRKLLLLLGYGQAQIEQMSKRKASGAIDYAIENPITEFGKKLKLEREKQDGRA